MPRRDGGYADDDERRYYEDVAALEAGTIPVTAQKRLQEIRDSADSAFSSDLTTREFLLLRSSRVRPLGQVMGTAFMPMPNDERALKQAIGVQGFGGAGVFGQNSSSDGYLSPSILWNSRGSRSTSARGTLGGGGSNFISNYGSSTGGGSGYNYGSVQPFTGEIYSLTSVHLDVRKLAIYRMEQEATILGASGIVGVRVVQRMHDWNGRFAEFTIFGTAVELPDWQGDQPFSSLLSGQEFWQLWEGGWEPKGIAIGACSYTDCTDWTTIHQRSYNRELITYTDCFYQAREAAMQQFVKDLRRLQAQGAVGMKVDYDFEEAESEYEVSEGNEMKYLHLLTHFVVMGTSISRRKTAPSRPPGRRVMIYDLRQMGAASVTFADKTKKGKSKSEESKPAPDKKKE